MTLWITSGSDTPIRPQDIDSDTSFIGVYGGQQDNEIAAYWIVRYCQARKSWRPFAFESLIQYVAAHTHPEAKAFLKSGVVGLILNGAIVNDDNLLTLTVKFVAHCYAAAPVRGLPRRKRVKKQPSEVYLKSSLEIILEADD